VAYVQLVKFTFTPTGKPKLKLGDTYLLGECQKGPQASEPDAGFEDCTRTENHGRAHSFDRGAWFTCSLGCCTADAGAA
jgi:hypothetical protein